MNNMQLDLSIGIPSVLVILAWISNKSDMHALRTEMRSDMTSLRTELRSDMASLRTEFRSDNDSLRKEMIGLCKEIYEAMIPLHERMAVIEIKQK
jgi:hypothetical protein